MVCEGSGFPEGDSANAPDFITGRFHDRTYAKIIIIFENDIVSRASRCVNIDENLNKVELIIFVMLD